MDCIKTRKNFYNIIIYKIVSIMFLCNLQVTFITFQQ